MSLQWPWLPGEYVSGPRVAETILRPVRPACLIPDDDEDVAAKFVETHCLAWGGQAGFVLPYSRSHGLSEGWRELLEVLDPDEVFALGPLQESVKDGLTDGGRFVYPRGEPAELFIQACTLVHSVLGAFGQGLKPPESDRFVVIPKQGERGRSRRGVSHKRSGSRVETMEMRDKPARGSSKARIPYQSLTSCQVRESSSLAPNTCGSSPKGEIMLTGGKRSSCGKTRLLGWKFALRFVLRSRRLMRFSRRF